MKHAHRTILTAVLCIGLGVAGSASAEAQEKPPAPEAPAPTRDDEAKKFVAETVAKFAKQDEADARASVTKIAELLRDKDVQADTRKSLVDLLAKYGASDRTAVATAAIDVLGDQPAESAAKPLRDLLERSLKAKAPVADVYGACLRALKKLADTSKPTLDLLTDLLKRKEYEVIAKAADAIAGYKDAPGKVRRELMEEVIKLGESAYQAAQSGKDSAANAKWRTIQGGVMSALGALSGQSFPDPLAARAWFNDHKKDAKVWG